MKNRNAWMFLGILSVLFFATVQGAAAQQVPLPNAFTLIGRFATNQTYLVSFDPNTGACARRTIGGANGLTRTTTVTGTSSADWITIASISGEHCGPWGSIHPVVTNGHTLVINAGAGVDVVDGQTIGGLVLRGDSGNDLVVTQGANSSLYGSSGNDDLRAGWGSRLRGEDGNDTMCANEGTTVRQFVGGLGFDTYCGASTFAPSSATKNCDNC